MSKKNKRDAASHPSTVGPGGVPPIMMTSRTGMVEAQGERVRAEDEEGYALSKFRVSMARECGVPAKLVAARNEDDAVQEYGLSSGIVSFGVRPLVEYLGPCYEDDLVPDGEAGEGGDGSTG